jgi:hypothetical protein
MDDDKLDPAPMRKSLDFSVTDCCDMAESNKTEPFLYSFAIATIVSQR